ncbi:HAD family hydrolase [Wenxinia marina]|uniref:Haloacid dehalogenase superfamily, subfamily IA, variant 3 with third motif having DD or ED n=1 Tax=Wenxinia marina DSM 24838 TaxID=1123501 RepID=A0A0D0Q9J6_9RHOB|nr:HAD-IA family hydrolase [Wenxinia marina]KIQ67688.1 haloacid dehalogenase superfamily, subfamily IA, variant 3 with third motif having DD or ED [Wenxinia marina DSM 24838]GGL79762.1 hydrolase [Wenxinia marina]
MTVRALLFDLDGTMLDTDPIHEAVFRDLLAPRGIAVDRAFYMEAIHGRLNVDFFAEYLPDEPDPQGLSERKEAEFRDRLPRPYPAAPGAARLIREAAARGTPMAVVTNAMRLNAEAMLEAIGLADAFATIVVGEECARAKPHPAPYLAACDALRVAPGDAVAFEDSPSGLASAAAAGCRVVGVRSALTDAALRAAGAHLTIRDFEDPGLDQLLERTPT